MIAGRKRPFSEEPRFRAASPDAEKACQADWHHRRTHSEYGKLAWSFSGTDCWGCGGELFVAGASNATYRGPGCLRWVDDGYLHRACSIPIPQFASPPVI